MSEKTLNALYKIAGDLVRDANAWRNMGPIGRGAATVEQSIGNFGKRVGALQYNYITRPSVVASKAIGETFDKASGTLSNPKEIAKRAIKGVGATVGSGVGRIKRTVGNIGRGVTNIGKSLEKAGE